MATISRIQRFVTVGAFAAALVGAPVAAAVFTAPAQDAVAAPPCLAWYGNKEDGKCLSYSNGNGIGVGTPGLGLGPGGGFYTSPLFPGRTINQGIG